MEEENKEKVIMENESNNNGGGSDDHVHVCNGFECDECSSAADKSSMDVDTFYEKICKSNESSGLSLVFNFRETLLDLYLFYKEVTQRGGFSQVTRDGKWDEVASILNCKSNNSAISSDQLQIVYQILLHRYEQTYYYRTPPKLPKLQKRVEKRKNCITKFSTPLEKKKCSFENTRESKGPETPEPKLTKQKALKKDPDAPLKYRSSYQMFLKIECERLKKLQGNNCSNLNVRDMATNAWRQLTMTEKQPYVEESKKDLERFHREMAAYSQRKGKQEAKLTPAGSSECMINFGVSAKTDGDYHVSNNAVSGVSNLPIDGDYYVNNNAVSRVSNLPDKGVSNLPDQSDIQMMKIDQVPTNETLFHVNWDEYCDLPSDQGCV